MSLWYVRHRARAFRETATMTVAWILPWRLVGWCAIRVMAHATTGRWGSEHPDKVTLTQALERWSLDNETGALRGGGE